MSFISSHLAGINVCFCNKGSLYTFLITRYRDFSVLKKRSHWIILYNSGFVLWCWRSQFCILNIDVVILVTYKWVSPVIIYCYEAFFLVLLFRFFHHFDLINSTTYTTIKCHILRNAIILCCLYILGHHFFQNIMT